MACAGCGTGVEGKPSGCKSNGGCSTGGCNRLNVFDWLSNIPLGDSLAPFDIIEVSFNNGSRKDFFRNVTKQLFDKGEMVTVEGVSGFDVGTVSLTGELVKLQMKKRRAEDTPEVKKVLRRSTHDDLQRMSDNKSREKEALIKSRALARNLGLEMKLAEVEIQADGRKATFFYTADDRVDFRELIKVYASEFRAKVEMRQIGARQEAGKVGGIGSCGRELCCSTWLSDFKSVNTTAARYQNLSINQAKLSGQCGRLKCCLNYELDTYLDALKEFPEDADSIETAAGVATLQKRDIFKCLMWYSYEGSNKQYPLTITRAKEIRLLNRQGVKPEDLKPVEVVTAKPKEADLGFADVVGLISLKSLEKTVQKRKQKDKDKHKQQKNADQKQGQGAKNESARPEQRTAQKPDNRPTQDRKPKHENRPQQQKQGGGGQQPKQGREQQPRQEQGGNKPQPSAQQQQGQGQPGGQKPKQDRRPPRHKPRPGNPNNPQNNNNNNNK
ncbi:PSP1 domain-containing protein [Chitinophaga nivalis]|uniref:Regulatory iron-sulfur-containing complex subunit RicT n=1 Tax=Chitinophaga nivalis TaxID=2991709 RepID=A0ABT3IVK2_9BACT|nr:regulatory iron-sulfur-containing complex subunit RicT [Chitinophaga nivalis]MCW3462287.1 regulatory iron-sulfur-containing complex subunit RicT [Chitinophaga nivalis]MCW3488022.1 regulatory iron-sulfur-containing complex subunit RicT [Chitinophaga nivalis]